MKSLPDSVSLFLISTAHTAKLKNRAHSMSPRPMIDYWITFQFLLSLDGQIFLSL